jgi:uncharacterized protein YkwD
MNLGALNISSAPSLARSSIKLVSGRSKEPSNQNDSESSTMESLLNLLSISPDQANAQKTYSESSNSTRYTVDRILGNSSWSSKGAVFGGSSGGSSGTSSIASSVTKDAFGNLSSSIDLFPENFHDSSNMQGFNQGANGADIKLPASATNLDPSSITDKTDPMVPNPNKVPLTEVEFEVVRLTNIARQQEGRPPLEVKSNLIETARESSFKMQAINSMEHGLTSGWGRENIAMGQRSAEDVVRAWLNSPGHYANIMSNSRFIGVGDTTATGQGNYWTMQLS